MALVSSFAKQHSSFSSLFEDVTQHLQIGLFTCLVLDDLNTDHHALPSYVANEGTLRFLLHSSELFQQEAPNIFRLLPILFLLQDVQHLASKPALERASCIGCKVGVVERISYLFSSHHRR